MERTAKIYVAGHRGLVGSAITRQLAQQGYGNVVLAARAELDLTDTAATRSFFEAQRPEYVFVAAAKVGGIGANDAFPAEFIRDNLAIQTNVVHEAWRSGVRRLLFLGSSCIYPKLAPQPIKEEHLLTGPLEPTNRPYAIAKIAGIEMCWSYNRQYGTRFLVAMPTNLYGPGDNYDFASSHVIPALLRKFEMARRARAEEVLVWGTGQARREFLYSDDMASACIHLMQLPEDEFGALLGDPTRGNAAFAPPMVNIGIGSDLSIAELTEILRQVVDYNGRIGFDTTKPDGTPRKLLDSSRLYATGWRPTVDLRQGLQLAYRDLVQRGVASEACR
jgi:GDP-L-fucose synthase